MKDFFQGVKVQFKEDIFTPILSPQKKSITYKYPKECTNSQCSPIKLTLQSGIFKFECWGAKGKGNPGLGAYTKGLIKIESKSVFYVFIGATGFYNALKDRTTVSGSAPLGSGGSTDVRLQNSADWWDVQSLASRIMVAAGGGSSEWPKSVGGHGGTLQGGESLSQYPKTTSTTLSSCKGATQTGSTQCDPVNFDNGNFNPTVGGFGFAGNPSTGDHGGFGGNGYYGGTSYPYAGAGSGGSSFISGHIGCVAIQKPTSPDYEIVHKDDPIHYSNTVFFLTEMIAGNQIMPHPDGGRKIWNEENGAFRLTYMLFEPCTCKNQDSTMKKILFVITLLSPVK